MSVPAEQRGRTVLPPLGAEATRAALSPPRLPASAVADAALARDAGALAVPVWLEVPARTGRTLLARALHAASGRTGPLVAPDGRWRTLADVPPGGSVLIHAETLPPSVVPIVESLIDDRSTWVLLSAPADHVLPAALAPRLDAIRLRGVAHNRYRWAAVNVVLNWACYLSVLAAILTGGLLYFDGGGRRRSRTRPSRI